MKIVLLGTQPLYYLHFQHKHDIYAHRIVLQYGFFKLLCAKCISDIFALICLILVIKWLNYTDTTCKCVSVYKGHVCKHTINFLQDIGSSFQV